MRRLHTLQALSTMDDSSVEVRHRASQSDVISRAACTCAGNINGPLLRDGCPDEGTQQ